MTGEAPTEFRVLGPIEIRAAGRPVALGSAKQRALLALLMLRAGEVVPVDDVVDELWGLAPPASAAQSVQMHVSRLRRVLATAGEAGAVVTRPAGYSFEADGERLDVRRRGSGLSYNQAQFCDPALDHLMDRAHALEATEPATANRIWARIDRALVQRTPVIPLYSGQVVQVTSARVGNYQYHPRLGPLLAQVWLR